MSIGVVGGSGGVGASTFAAVLAHVALSAILIDLDPVGGGLDTLLGIEHEPGARWSGLRVGGGHLDPDVLAAGLPRWSGVPVLAVDLPPPGPDPVIEVLTAAGDCGAVVVDLPRAPGAVRDAAVLACDLVLVLVDARVRQLSAGRALLASLPEVPVVALVRRGDVPAEEVHAAVGVEPIGALPVLSRGVDLTSGRVPAPLARVAGGVVDGMSDVIGR